MPFKPQGVGAIGKLVSWSSKKGMRRHLSWDQCVFIESSPSILGNILQVNRLFIYACFFKKLSVILLSSLGKFSHQNWGNSTPFDTLQELLFGLLDYDHDKLFSQGQRKVLYQDTQCTVWHCHISYGCALWMEVVGNIVSFTTRIFLSNLTSFGMPKMMWLLAFNVSSFLGSAFKFICHVRFGLY